jgi:hypothetical protein
MFTNSGAGITMRIPGLEARGARIILLHLCRWRCGNRSMHSARSFLYCPKPVQRMLSCCCSMGVQACTAEIQVGPRSDLLGAWGLLYSWSLLFSAQDQDCHVHANPSLIKRQDSHVGSIPGKQDVNEAQLDSPGSHLNTLHSMPEPSSQRADQCGVWCAA